MKPYKVPGECWEVKVKMKEHKGLKWESLPVVFKVTELESNLQRFIDSNFVNPDCFEVRVNRAGLDQGHYFTPKFSTCQIN